MPVQRLCVRIVFLFSRSLADVAPPLSLSLSLLSSLCMCVWLGRPSDATFVVSLVKYGEYNYEPIASRCPLFAGQLQPRTLTVGQLKEKKVAVAVAVAVARATTRLCCPFASSFDARSSARARGSTLHTLDNARAVTVPHHTAGVTGCRMSALRFQLCSTIRSSA